MWVVRTASLGRLCDILFFFARIFRTQVETYFLPEPERYLVDVQRHLCAAFTMLQRYGVTQGMTHWRLINCWLLDEVSFVYIMNDWSQTYSPRLIKCKM